MEKMLTLEEALQAMRKFLDFYYFRTYSDDVGSLLGDTNVVHKRMTMDPAAWGDWLNAVRLALKAKSSFSEAEIEARKLTTLDTFKAMRQFLKAYHIRTSSASKDLALILENIKLTNQQMPKNLVVWEEWLSAIESALKEPAASCYEDCQECQRLLSISKSLKK